jgi:hypothetical protein
MPHRLPGLLLGCLLLILAMPAAALAAPATVSVRAEGDTTTVLPRTTVTTNTTPVTKDGDPNHSCSGTAAIGALELATAGDWAGSWNQSFGWSLDAIKGEAHTFAHGDYWGFWINNRYATTGLCDTELQEGDSLLYFVDTCNDFDPGSGDCLDARFPTSLTAPKTANRGTFTVHVDKYDKQGNASALAGATVTGGDSAVTTDASGNAAVTLSTTGTFELKATKTGFVRSEGRPVCVHDGNDGTCGTTKPGDPVAPETTTEAAAQCATSGDDGRCGTTDKRPSLGRITFAREGQRFARGRGPRTLAGTAAADPSGLRAIRLRLTWSDGKGHCSTYDGTREQLVRPKRCGAAGGRWFSAGDRQDWSYLLPARLGTGRWVLDVEVTDGAGNTDGTLQRGRNRIVFRVG